MKKQETPLSDQKLAREAFLQQNKTLTIEKSKRLFCNVILSMNENIKENLLILFEDSQYRSTKNRKRIIN